MDPLNRSAPPPKLERSIGRSIFAPVQHLAAKISVFIMRKPAMKSAGVVTLVCTISTLMVQFAEKSTDQQWTVLPYHLTARPWEPLNVPRRRYLDVIEGVCRFSIQYQNEKGAIIDPFLKREYQYATPYFAYAVGTLINGGKALDLLPNGVKAMEDATVAFGGGRPKIPDDHGEFFIAALTGALPLYEEHVPRAQWESWCERMKSVEVTRGGTNNWETYVMKGDWMRQRAGLENREAVVSAIESAWRKRQRARIARPPSLLYHDRTSDPDTLSVEAVGRGNLLALINLGYDGPSAAEIRHIAETATANALLLQDSSGQAPVNGRTDNHLWVDIGYQLAFEIMAERSLAAGDLDAAGRFRHAAMMTFESAQRWRRSDGVWAGSFFVTKNHFDPILRVGYQQASAYSNYNGSLMFHLAEAFNARQSDIAERPAPAEIGGYALALDHDFATAFANAGGMQMQVNLRGQTGESYGNRWTPLGVVRLARVGWDTRLGPSDGALTAKGGLSFAPSFFEKGHWVRMADLSATYQGTWSAPFVHPLLVRCSITYAPKFGRSGPVFRNDFVLTPDGILSTVRKISPGDVPWGVTWPLLENDGRPLSRTISARTATVHYPGSTDKQCFLALHARPALAVEDCAFRSTYGDLRAVRMTTPDEESRTFIYPQSNGDPSAEDVQRSFVVNSNGFHSLLGRVEGNLYIGRTSAGGFGNQLDLDNDGKPDATFSKMCGFVVQLKKGKIVAVEADRAVTMKISGHELMLTPYHPILVANTR